MEFIVIYHCAKCSLEIQSDSYVKLINNNYKDGAREEIWCIQCWHNSLDDDSGNYFDNFIDK